MTILDKISKIFDFAIKNEENINTVLRYLSKYGYLDADNEHDVEDLLKAIINLSKAVGLDSNGTITTQTLRIMQLPRCACKDIGFLGQDATALNKWGKNSLTYCLASRPGSVSKDVWASGFRKAFDFGEAVCNIKFIQVSNKEEADFFIEAGQGPQNQFDGKGGVLAWCELPPIPNFDGKLHSMFDADELWNGPGIQLINVACHEIVGHGLGLPHTNVPKSLMNPFYDATIDRPQTNDIAELVARYGKPLNTSQPQPKTPVTPIGDITLTITGKISDIQAPGFRIYRE